jgi:Tol biopolymer transport system component
MRFSPRTSGTIRAVVGPLLIGALLAWTAGCGDEAPAVGPPLTTAPALSRPELAIARSLTAGRQVIDDIVRSDGDLGNVALLIPNPGKFGRRETLVSEPAWSPDGMELAYTLQIGNYPVNSDIYVVRADGSHPRRLTHDGRSGAPAWSADGRRIVFTHASHDPAVNVDVSATSLWTMRSDGSDIRPLTEEHSDRTYDAEPAWSPDGSEIAFDRGQPSSSGISSDLYLVKPDGSGVRKIADSASDPAYSPDGIKIAFTSDRDQNGEYMFGEDETGPASELYVMKADGGGARRLTMTKGLNEVAPSWSSDGARIAYEQQGLQFKKSVFEISADGSCPTAILSAPGSGTWYSEPAWRPGSRPGPLAC